MTTNRDYKQYGLATKQSKENLSAFKIELMRDTVNRATIELQLLL